MERIFKMILSQRSVVLLPFPFSDLKQSKVRPVIIVSNNRYNKRSKDMLVVPLTSNLRNADYDVLVTEDDMEKGNLIADSKAKADKIFSIGQSLAIKDIGKINIHAFSKIKKIITTVME